MPKQVATDVFESLGGAAKATGQQVASDVKKMGEDFLESLGLKPAQGQEAPGPDANQQKEEGIKQAQEADKNRSIARYREIKEEIRALQKKRSQEIPKEISGKPGFDEEKAVKQLETAPFAKASEGQGKKLPPLPAQRESKKAEMFRGVSG